MTRHDKLKHLFQEKGIDPSNPQLRIREGSSGAHTIPKDYEQVFDMEVDSVRVRAFLPPIKPPAPPAPKPKFFGRALK